MTDNSSFPFLIPSIGIMQGRLSPPIDDKIQAFPLNTWEQEFYLAKKIGFDFIDWVIDQDLHENPLLIDRYIPTIKELISKTGIYIGAVCADYFINYPLVRCSNTELDRRLDVLNLLVDRLNYFGIKYLELPFLDNSAILNGIEIDRFVGTIRPTLDKAEKMGIIIAIETSLPVKTFKNLINKLDHPSVRINYDTGNSASLGYNPKEELENYGEFVATVHIKDRILGGGTVPLGKGDTDFSTFFSVMRTKKYVVPFILQAAREGDEIESARKNLSFVKNFLI